MLDWEFDELVDDVLVGVEDSNLYLNPISVVAVNLDDYESAIINGEVEEVTVILSIFMTPFKNLIMKTYDYNILNEIIEKYNSMDKNRFTKHQKEVLEEMIRFYDENIYKMKLWGRDKDEKEIFRQVILDEDGNKKLVEIKNESVDKEVITTTKSEYPELSNFITNCKETKEFDNNKFLELIKNIENLPLDTNREKLYLLYEINNNIWDFPYYDIRDEDRKMNLDGRYERKKILEGLVIKLGIKPKEIVSYKDFEEIKRKVKKYDRELEDKISEADFLELYNLINGFYNEMMEKICNEKFYIWCDYKKKLSSNKVEGIEEEYQKRLTSNKEEKRKEIDSFDEILKDIWGR